MAALHEPARLYENQSRAAALDAWPVRRLVSLEMRDVYCVAVGAPHRALSRAVHTEIALLRCLSVSKISETAYTYSGVGPACGTLSP